MEKALFIGRFQPFHSGHLDAIRQISELEIIIGIGSSQYSNTNDNPYSFTERKKMIETTLQTENLNYKIIAIPDIHDKINWVDHVKKIVKDFDVVYTGNNLVKKLFQNKGYVVKNIKKNIDISGTEIRQETSQLLNKLIKIGYTKNEYLHITPLTLRINKLKKQ